ncbi:MAG: 50S ribosomal protein L23 [candidate division Zixibacteria bacterium]|jgi:large subunit ribosomal protein L23|nr:50S ribosomal protein L23 [candidate division Zixibacteria bacterium]
MKEPRRILQLHLMTEKTTRLKELGNIYVFKVDRSANKREIKSAIEKVFGVKVDTVRTMVVPAKPKRMGRYEGRSTAWKKAIVKLKKDQQIAAFENL